MFSSDNSVFLLSWSGVNLFQLVGDVIPTDGWLVLMFAAIYKFGEAEECVESFLLMAAGWQMVSALRPFPRQKARSLWNKKHLHTCKKHKCPIGKECQRVSSPSTWMSLVSSMYLPELQTAKVSSRAQAVG